MKTWSVWLSGAFAAGLLLLAVAAGWRAAPVRIDTAGWWDGSATRAFESHYDAVFPVRTLGINLWTAIGYALFDEGKPGLVVGRHDWLYTVEEFAAAADAGAQVTAHLGQIDEARRRLARRGSALLVALVPAKARIYPQHLAGQKPAALHAELYAQALAALRAQRILAPDLQRTLAACATVHQAFLRTDTHWTPAGARCAAERLAVSARSAGLRARQTVAYRTSLAPAAAHRGDLLTFLPLDPWFAGLLPQPDRLEVPRTEPAARGGLLDEQPRPEVVLIGTSYSADPKWNFTGALQQAFGEDVVNYAAPARGPFVPMREYLDSAALRAAPPRLVIWEIPERYLPLRDDAADPSPEPEKLS
jgi:alginate O-acetyltransferase complex protein AlgJ